MHISEEKIEPKRNGIGSLVLSSLFSLELDWKQRTIFLAKYDQRSMLEPIFEDLFYSYYFNLAIANNATNMILNNHYGKLICTIDFDSATIKNLHQLNRDDKYDPGMFRFHFVETDSCLLAVYERGLVAIRLDLNSKLWSVDDLYLDDHFDRIENGIIWYGSEFSNDWGYKLENGEMVKP